MARSATLEAWRARASGTVVGNLYRMLNNIPNSGKYHLDEKILNNRHRQELEINLSIQRFRAKSLSVYFAGFRLGRRLASRVLMMRLMGTPLSSIFASPITKGAFYMGVRS